MTYRETMPVMISMLAIGVVQYYVLRCARIELNPPVVAGPARAQTIVAICSCHFRR